MMPEKLKKGWCARRFDQMAVMVNDRIDNPAEANVEHYVGLEHLDSDSLTIRRWGTPSDVEATKLRFRVGDIIFGRRRVYQRKLAVAHFDGICSAHAMVLRPKTDVVLPEFLPFFMQSDLFMERAKEISVGSLSPTINWKTLAQEEFALPPLEEQRRIAEVLSACEEAINRTNNAADSGEKIYRSWLLAVFGPRLKDTSEDLSSESSAGVKWKWQRVDSLFDLQLGKMSSKKAREGSEQTPYIKNNNVLWDNFVLDILPTMSFSATERQKFSLIPGDLLVCEGGEIGRTAIWKDVGLEIVYQKALHRLRPLDDRVSPGFFLHYLRYCAFSGTLDKIATGTTILHLPQERLATLRLPFPGIREQQSIAGSFDEVLKAAVLARDRTNVIRVMKSRLVQEALKQ
jgi:type I restriction enzyme, S subunit